MKWSSDTLLKFAIALGLFVLNPVFLSLLILGGAHSGIGIIGAYFFFPAFIILSTILPASSPLNGPEINFSFVLFLTQFLIMTAIAFAGLALKKQLTAKRTRPEQRK